MYQVYSQQRPGRPRWTLGASAMVLLLTLGFASGVIQYKDRALRAHLSDVKSFTRGALKCAIPAGWELVPTPQAEELVAYLLSLKQTYEFAEARPYEPAAEQKGAH